MLLAVDFIVAVAVTEMLLLIFRVFLANVARAYHNANVATNVVRIVKGFEVCTLVATAAFVCIASGRSPENSRITKNNYFHIL